MKKSIFAFALLALLASVSFVPVAKAQESPGSGFSNQTVVGNIISQQENEHLTGKSEKERKREMARLKKQYEMEKRKERWTNINPDSKKKEEIKRKAIDATNGGGEFDVSKMPKSVRDHIQKLTPEDKSQDQKEVLKTWTQLSPPEKAYIKKAGKEKWKTLTKEEQEQFKAIMAYEKTANGTAFDKPAAKTASDYGVKAVGRTSLPENYFGDIGHQAKSPRYKVQPNRNLNNARSGSGYSYSMFGPGGANRAAGTHSYGESDSAGN